MKYKKLDNLDDLRVGDVVVDLCNLDWKVLMVMNGMVFFPGVPVMIHTIETLKEWKWTAKRPLPEKVEKWQPKIDEQYFFPRFHDQISGCVAQTIWDGGEWDSNLLKLGMVFRTRRECEEAALKMIKAINPNYNE